MAEPRTARENANSLTSEQIAAILYRYAKQKGYDVSKSAALTALPSSFLPPIVEFFQLYAGIFRNMP